ncbi:geranylgeranyl transferase type-2 subunit alpha [Cephus cinctus]|uniref:Geranylgeranyl transferase type-2 subunit alpha n=1 Tax=Cephus cinctus TaxID=211228 RepID=A0AAJ7RUJ6_CEPCN|nr:geranylgeranyl transferase type-2 subunit alpha [Cephus cinctus]
MGKIVVHGRVKVRTTAEQEEIKKVERAKKVAEYKAGMNLVFQKRRDKIYDDELLLVTERIVVKNPDIYTLWNIRREAFNANDWSNEEREIRMKKDLSLTECCLRENPKSYYVWHHRCWVIERLSEPDWETELALCAKCLNYDERNFHCWEYRLFVVQKAGISDEEEFNFSTTKILNNFSNYSSWHYRSKVLSKMFPDNTGALPIRSDKHKEELDLVMNATFTDPNDSSAWFYQRWLLDSHKSINNPIWRAQLTSTAATVVFHKDVAINSLNLNILVDGTNIPLNWESHDNAKFAKVWSTPPNEIFINLNDDMDGETFTCKINIESQEKHNLNQLQEQLESYQQLIQMEPHNKWALLTGIFLMRNINDSKYHKNILENFTALKTIDKLRSNYYEDLRSKYLIDYVLHNTWLQEDKTNEVTSLDMSNYNLTLLCNEHYLSFYSEVNLCGNNLGNSLHRLHSLQRCKKLSLSCNGIKSLEQFPTLFSLKVLLLRYNELSSVDEILELVKRHRLITLDIRENLVCMVNGIVQAISEVSPDTTVLTD